MNKCPICGNGQAINDIGIIIRKKITCCNCKKDLILIENPSSFLVDLLVDLFFVVLLLAIYVALRKTGYDRWVGIPLLLIGSFALFFVKERVPTEFTVSTAESLEPIRRAEKANLLLLAGIVALVALLLFICFRNLNL